MPAQDPRVINWQARFERAPLARKVVAALARQTREIWTKTFHLLRQQSPEYRSAVDDEFTEESKSHCGELLATITAIASGRLTAPDPFDFVREHAEWRARRHVPLVASLHAYRLAHKTYWDLTREALGIERDRRKALRSLEMLTDFWFEFFEAVGGVLEEAHAAEEARIAAQNSSAYPEIIDDLLNGKEPRSAEAQHLLTLCRIHPAKAMSVAVIRPFPANGGSHVDSDVTLRSLVRLLHQALPSTDFGTLIGQRCGEIVVIANSARDTSKSLIQHLGQSSFRPLKSTPPRAAAGVSLDTTDIARLPLALGEARIALEIARPGRPLQPFANIDVADFVIHNADRSALRLIPEWVRAAHASGGGNDLIRTILTFAECSLNVKETARRLGVHTNTVYYRLNQVKRHSGTDPRTFSGICSLVTGLRLLDRNRHL